MTKRKERKRAQAAGEQERLAAGGVPVGDKTKARDLRVGDRVEVTAGGFPFQGRTGVIRKLGVISTQVWCDAPDALGRQLIRTPRSTLRRLPDQPPAPVSTTGVADELAKLAELRDAGVLSPEEFETQKARLLGTE